MGLEVRGGASILFAVGQFPDWGRGHNASMSPGLLKVVAAVAWLNPSAPRRRFLVRD
jgi:hypothetical protein